MIAPIINTVVHEAEDGDVVVAIPAKVVVSRIMEALSKTTLVLNQVEFNVLKNPNPLKDDEAFALLVAAVLALVLFWGSSML